MEALKCFSRVLNNASVSQVRQGSGQLNIDLLLTGNLYLVFGNTPIDAININSASERRAIDKHLTG